MTAAAIAAVEVAPTLLRAGEARLEQGDRLLVLVLLAGEVAGAVEHLGACLRRFVRGDVERSPQPAASLGDVAVHVPEQPQRPREPHRGVDLAVVEEPVEAPAEVVVLVLEALQPDSLLGALQERLGPLGQREEPLRVPATDRVGVVRGREALAGQLADRLQHPEPPAGPPHEALVDQRLQPVDVGCDDLFGGVERAAAREDRQPREQPLLVVAEEVVRPLDRRAKRLLARCPHRGRP